MKHKSGVKFGNCGKLVVNRCGSEIHLRINKQRRLYNLIY